MCCIMSGASTNGSCRNIYIQDNRGSRHCSDSGSSSQQAVISSSQQAVVSSSQDKRSEDTYNGTGYSRVIWWHARSQGWKSDGRRLILIGCQMEG